MTDIYESIKIIFDELPEDFKMTSDGLKGIRMGINALIRKYGEENIKKNKELLVFMTKFDELNLSFLKFNSLYKNILEVVKKKIEKETKTSASVFIKKIEKEGLGKPVFIDFRVSYIKDVLGRDFERKHHRNYKEGLFEISVSRVHDIEKEIIETEKYSLYIIKNGCIPFATDKELKGRILTFEKLAHFLLKMFRDVNFEKEIKKQINLETDRDRAFFMASEKQNFINVGKNIDDMIKNKKTSTLVKAASDEIILKYLNVYMMLYRFRNKCTEEWETSTEFIEFRDLPESRMTF